MENSENMKLVNFDEYCKCCHYKKTKESENPCYECLQEPARQHSHKPARFEEAKRQCSRTKRLLL